MKTLILALGNPILSDDGVAREVADRLEECLHSSLGEKAKQYDIIKSSGATMDIVPQLAGYQRLAVIDAVQLGLGPPGTMYRLDFSDLASTVQPSSPHDINFATALEIAKTWGYHIPPDIRIYGIEVKELLRFSGSCTSEVVKKLDEIVQEILVDLVK